MFEGHNNEPVVAAHLVLALTEAATLAGTKCWRPQAIASLYVCQLLIYAKLRRPAHSCFCCPCSSNIQSFLHPSHRLIITRLLEANLDMSATRRTEQLTHRSVSRCPLQPLARTKQTLKDWR